MTFSFIITWIIRRANRGARLTHNGPFHGPRLHVCINTQKFIKTSQWLFFCIVVFILHPQKHFWNLFQSPNLMAREHKGWKQNLQSIPKVQCGTLSRVSWYCQAGMNRTTLSGLYLPHRNSCRELDMKQLSFFLWFVNRWSSFSSWILGWRKYEI